ncbi:MAG: C1 family peptidase [bacterium]|nr:C1 family peptidase [bacterium]
MNLISKLHILAITLLVSLSTAMGRDTPIEEIKKAIKDKGANWIAGETSVSKLSKEQKKALCGWTPYETLKGSKKEIMVKREPPPEFDWRNHNNQNWMTPIRNQGNCGSCWAFGALGALEALINICTNTPDLSMNLSEQYLLSCSPGGCGGWTIGAVCEFLKQNEVVDEACFQYQANDEIPCENKCTDWEWRRRKVMDWGWVTSSVDTIKAEIMNGPVEVGFLVYEDFMYYNGGIYEHVWGDLLGAHAVAMLGWNDNDSCWICKNSWGPYWGESGWFRIKWGQCEIETAVAWMVPMDNRLPLLTYVYYTIEELVGDGDSVLNPGETALMKVALCNEPSWSKATNVTAILSSSNHMINLIDSIGAYGDIEPGDTVTNSDEGFKFSIREESGVCSVPVSLFVTANEGALPYLTELKFNIEVTLNQAGWPVILGYSVNSSPVVIDIDNDGINEVIVGCNDGNLHVINADGSTQHGFPFSTGAKIESSPAIGDVDKDGSLDIVVGSWDNKIYIIKKDGSLLTPPIVTGGHVTATPVLSDLDNNGDMEIIIGSFDKKLYVLNHDGTSYNANFPYSVSGIIYAGAAVADLDEDGVNDIIFGTLDNKIYAISANGTLLSGWPFSTGGKISSAPSIANLDGSGLKVVVGSWDKNLYILNPDATEALHISTNGAIKSSPSFVDFDNDNDLEVVFGSNDGYIYAYHHDGNLVEGWHVPTGSMIQASACFSDIDNDGTPEVVIGSSDNNLYACHIDGSLVFGFPIPTGGSILSSPAIIDLDKDGDFELVFGNNYGIQTIDYKSKAGSSNYWNMYRAVPARTGNYYNIPQPGIVESGNKPSIPIQFSLSQSYPNPCGPVTYIKYTLPKRATVNISIYNVSGRLVETLLNKSIGPGSYTVSFESKNLPSGVYFVRFQVGHRIAAKEMILIK